MNYALTMTLHELRSLAFRLRFKRQPSLPTSSCNFCSLVDFEARLIWFPPWCPLAGHQAHPKSHTFQLREAGRTLLVCHFGGLSEVAGFVPAMCTTSSNRLRSLCAVISAHPHSERSGVTAGIAGGLAFGATECFDVG